MPCCRLLQFIRPVFTRPAGIWRVGDDSHRLCDLPILLAMLLALSLLSPTNSIAQEEDADFPPGALARYTVGDKTIERIDPDISFVWDTAAPDARLPEGPFVASWDSQLLVRQAGRYRLHAYLQGTVKVTVDGQPVLAGEADVPGWISGQEFDLSFGEKSLNVQFTKSAASARLQLFWSADHFQLEPLPAQLLFRDGGNAELQRIEQGRLLFAAHRCNRCHQRSSDLPSAPAPALTTTKTGLSAEWITSKLTKSSTTAAHVRMPEFGFTAAEAASIAVFLLDASKEAKLQQPPAVKEKDRGQEQRKGEVLLRSTGCLACHQVGKHGQDAGLGGDLSDIGNKRSSDWLYTWLGQPEKLNPDHRMPVFKLSSTERRQLARVLSQLKTQPKPKAATASAKANKAEIEAGRKLVEAARCAACHQIPGVKADLAGIPDLSQPTVNWEQSCVQATANRARNRPAYRQVDRETVAAYVNSRTGQLSPVGLFDQGRLVLEQRACLNCHERDQNKGMRTLAGLMARVDPDLNGHSEGMIPPALTAIGDKLRDEALAEAVSGEQKNVRLPWLHVRMPKFRHDSKDKQALVAYLVGHDRIPDNPPATAAITTADQSNGKPISETILLAGHTIVGAKGLSCIACHKVGAYEPRNVALGTRGSDLLMLGQRMRQAYFTRWTRSPLRIVPGMEMPSYIKPVPGVLDGEIDTQLDAAWLALNDSRFKAPTDPSSVEQFFFVKAGEPARIIRDVFTNPEENGGGYVPRAFAVGLNNGHNLLFDLDVFALRQWTFGDMARQRTVGKSWYWDMAGVPVVTGFGTASDFALQPQRQPDGSPVFPKSDNGTNGRLVDYEQYGNGGTRLNYTLNFELNGTVHVVHVSETLLPTAESATSATTGCDRRIEVTGLPVGYDLLFSRPVPKASLGSPSVELVDQPAVDWKTIAGPTAATAQRQFVRFSNQGGNTVATVRYAANLKRPALDLKLKPKQPPVIGKITSAPGFEGVRLPFADSIMPTAMTWLPDGTLAFTSLKGHVYLAHDTDGDGIEDKLTLFEEGLAAPYGIIADGNDLIVAHKPELVRLQDTDGDGRADTRTVFATGWGFNDNYHDWTTGIVRDSKNNLYIGLGSNYAQKGRPREFSRWRGKVLRVAPNGAITPFSHEFRYPTGLAINEKDQLFSTDNQGVQNTFNEINYLVEGDHYGVPSLYEEKHDTPPRVPAVQVPHPWTRSVNGLFFLPPDFAVAELAGQGVGCEFNGKRLVRFSLQQVGDVMQGAIYHLTLPDYPNNDETFLGPICGAVGPDGHIYVGSLYDSGWLGGQNTGSIARLTPNGKLPNGIRELKATSDGFELHFMAPVDAKAALKAESYSISGYTRVWGGGYATPDSGRYRVNIKSIDIADDAQTVTLHVDRLQEGYVYEVSCGSIAVDKDKPLWPGTGHYTLTRIP